MCERAWRQEERRYKPGEEPPSVPPCQGGGETPNASTTGSLPDKGGRGEGFVEEGFLPYAAFLTPLARENRKNPTAAERKIWNEVLRKRQFARWKFLRQKPIDGYIVDFYSAALRLVIEIDGDSHADTADYDAERTKILRAYGLTVLRFTNDDVLRNIEGVYGCLISWLTEKGL